MAFTSKNLSMVQGANSNSGRVFKYKSTDTLAVITASAYFSTADTVKPFKKGTEMGLIDESVIIVQAGDGISVIRLNVTTAGVASTDMISSGGSNVELVTADLSPVAADNGKTFVLEKAAGIAVTLPAVAAGLKFKFISGTIVVTSVGHVITATAADIEGSVTVAGLVVAVAAGTVLTMTANAVLPGDWFTLESDGVNWYISGQATASTGIVKTS